jgi:hypothetical protein
VPPDERSKKVIVERFSYLRDANPFEQSKDKGQIDVRRSSGIGV